MRRRRRQTTIDFALFLLARRRRYVEQLQSLVRKRGLRATLVVLVLLALTGGAWWTLAPSIIVKTAFVAAIRGDETVVDLFADTQAIAEGFFEEWAAITALRPDGTPRAVSLSVKPEAVGYIMNIYRAEMNRARSGNARILKNAEVHVTAQLSWRAIQDIPVQIRRGDTEVQFHARIVRNALRWRIIRLPGSVAAFAQLVDP